MFRKREVAIHFVGIGGVGMSGIAEVLLSLGYRVSGSDLKEGEVTRRLAALGGRICIGHSADTTDIDYLESLLQAGVFLSMDRYDVDPADWHPRNATVKALVDRGWAHRLMLGHDELPTPVGAGAALLPPDDPPSYLLVSTVVVPALRAAGVSAEAVQAMLVDAPRRFLTGELRV